MDSAQLKGAETSASYAIVCTEDSESMVWNYPA